MWESFFPTLWHGSSENNSRSCSRSRAKRILLLHTSSLTDTDRQEVPNGPYFFTRIVPPIQTDKGTVRGHLVDVVIPFHVTGAHLQRSFSIRRLSRFPWPRDFSARPRHTCAGPPRAGSGVQCCPSPFRFLTISSTCYSLVCSSRARRSHLPLLSHPLLA